ALAPILGTALVILFVSPGTYAYRLLACKLAVGIGLISYSAYLWHQPVFAFARVSSKSPLSTFEFAGLSVLSLVLAYFSWRFVERPFRNKEQFGRKRIFALSAIGIMMFG